MDTISDGIESSLNLLEIIKDANIVVQLVVFLLLFLSIYSWSVAIQSFSDMRSQKKKINFLNIILTSTKPSLDELQHRLSSMRNSSGFCLATNLLNIMISAARGERVTERTMRIEMERTMIKQEKGLVTLANVSSLSPFIGLFGTVVGIMHSFSSVFATQTVMSIRVIAPSISEALFATAMGIFVAIPAGMFYNKLVSEVRYLRSEAENIINLFSKNIER